MKRSLERVPGSAASAVAVDGTRAEAHLCGVHVAGNVARGIAGHRSERGARPLARACVGFLIFAAAAIFATSAQARDARADADLAFDCAALHLPSQQEVAQLLGTHNFEQTYRGRERLLQNVRRQCLRGARQVLVKADAAFGQATLTELVNTR